MTNYLKPFIAQNIDNWLKSNAYIVLIVKFYIIRFNQDIFHNSEGHMSKLSRDVVKNNVDISYHMTIFVTRLVTIIRYK